PCHLQFQDTEDGPRMVLRFVENVPLLRNPLLRLGLPAEIASAINRRLRARAGGLLFISSLNARTLDHIYSSILAGLAQTGGNDVLSLEVFQRRRLPGVTPVHCPSEESMLIDLGNAEYMTPDVIGLQAVKSAAVL